jgi:serine protease Do
MNNPLSRSTTSHKFHDSARTESTTMPSNGPESIPKPIIPAVPMQPIVKHQNRLGSGFLVVIILMAVLPMFVACNNSTEDNTTDSAEIQEQIPEPPGYFLDHPPSRSYDESLAYEIDKSRQSAITRAVQRVSPSVVSVLVTGVRESHLTNDPFFNFFFNPGFVQEFTNMGSGFIISEDGHVLTNEHVIGRNPSSIQINLSNGKTYNAMLIGRDEYADLALLKIDSEDRFEYLQFGNSDDLIVGEWAIAVGNPFGLFDDGQPSVTVGVISALKRDFRPNPQDPRVYLNMIQTDAAINRGNSGGPLVNSLGEVIGINTFIYTGGTSYGFVGLGFAIPSNTVIRILNMLVESGEVRLGYDAGFEWTAITRGLAFRYNLPTLQGLFVVSVNRDGPAFEAGLLPGDIVLRVGDEPIYSHNHAWALFREYSEGALMKVEILRDGLRYETELTLRKKVLAE